MVFQNQYKYYVNGQAVLSQKHNHEPELRQNTDIDLGILNGKLDEFRIYNRALSDFEIELLHQSAQSPFLLTTGEHNATVGTAFSLSLAADNSPTTYLAEGLPDGLSLNVTTGQITGTVSEPGYHRIFVKAMNAHGTGSDTIAILARPAIDPQGWPVDVPDGSGIPQNGLVLWLDANDVDADGVFDSGTDHLKLANWVDKAGQDHNATQANAANQPEIRAGQLAAKPNLNVLVFDGNQSLTFPTISQGRTFFWVVERGDGASSQSTFFSGSNQWGYIQGNNILRFGSDNFYNGIQRRNGYSIS